MSSPEILVAIPNISEGRDESLVRRVAVSGALIDVHSDPTHNRSVLTYAGAPASVVDAGAQVLERAMHGLDLTHHEGAHPRHGVVDVFPLVPYACREAVAEAAAARLSDAAVALGLPVYLYDGASPEGLPLPDLRRRLRSGRPPCPDAGPSRPHPTAGVVCIGIRGPLVAFNVYVRGAPVTLRSLARAMRRLPAVRALAFPDQISMNLIDPQRTGPRRAFEACAELAAAAGLPVESCEVVGLVPAAQLPELEGLPLRAPVRSIEDALT